MRVNRNILKVLSTAIAAGLLMAGPMHYVWQKHEAGKTATHERLSPDCLLCHYGLVYADIYPGQYRPVPEGDEENDRNPFPEIHILRVYFHEPNRGPPV